jgi:hypothetical protein
MTNCNRSLFWEPGHQLLEDWISNGDQPIIVISPFIKIEAIKRLLNKSVELKGLKVICRWREDDLLSGVSDVELYPYLRDLGHDLYLHSEIHLKLYIFNSDNAFCTSSNITLKGLGYAESSNLELGSKVKLTVQDWTHIYTILNQSKRVDDNTYSIYKDYVTKNKTEKKSLPKVLLPSDTLKKYTIFSLPASSDPRIVKEIYYSENQSLFSEDDIRRAAHDLSLYGFKGQYRHLDFLQKLQNNFLENEFVKDFKELIRIEQSLRFGFVNDWIHSKCDDVPLPYRWEIKSSTSVLYNWLAWAIPEISWDRPNYSQVIYWDDLSVYLHYFSSLNNRDLSRDYSDITKSGAPYQPLLLLCIIDLYEINTGRINLFNIDDSLLAYWEKYTAVLKISNPINISVPIVALKEEPFWHLIPHSADYLINGRIRSIDSFQKNFNGFKLDQGLHRLLGKSSNRTLFKETLLYNFFNERSITLIKSAFGYK